MYFAETDLKFVLEILEERIAFNGDDDLSSAQNWNIYANLKVQDLIDKEPGKANTIRYVVKILHDLGYIEFASNDFSIIKSVTPSGCKLLLSKLRNVNLDC